MASFLKQMEELEKLKKKAQVAPKLQTHKGVSSGTPSSMPRAIDNLSKVNASQKAGMAAEKATRVFLQNSPDAYLPRPQQVGPSQWKGPTNTKNIGSVPGMSAAKRAASSAERASMAYQNAFLPTPKKQNTYGPQKWNGGAEELSAYNPFKKGPSVFETAMNNAKNMEQLATPTEARSGGGLFNRVYNAASSIGDSMIGADKSLKATAKQAFNNEKEYRKTLAEFDSDINAYMAERDKYAPDSKEYKAINTVINNLYNAIDDLRNKAADMTDANEFMRSAEKLRNEATKGLSGLGLDLAEAGISMADNLTTMALTGFNPTATLALMGAKSAGQRANQLSNQGVSARDALGRGVISGVIEGLTEKIGLDNLFGLVKSNNIKALSSILKQAAAEGGEEGLSNILNYAVDWASGDRKDFDWDDFARSVRQGALSGLGFGIGGVASNTVLPRATGYSDMGHLNMERAVDGKRYGEILPRAVKKYSSDVSGVNVNIGSETVQNYINRIQKPINANEINSSIKIDMSETEREPILKNMSIKVSDATRKAVPAEITDKINSGKLNEAYKAIKAFAKSLGVFKQYENENIDIKFNFSGESYNKSKSEHMIRKNNVNDFLLMVNDFDNIIQNAIPIEIHSDRINGGALKNVRVLVSAFWNGKEVVPVEIEVKEYNQQENEPKLYMAVTINKKGNAVFAGSSLQSMHALALPYGDTVFVGSPKMGPQTLASPSESDAVMDNSTKIAPLAVSSPSTISLPDLIKGVNGNNGDFLKYFPDSMLDDEQIAYKNAALEKERVKIEPLETRAFAEKSEIQSVNEVSSDSKNIIPQTSENINNSAPKELGKRQVMPEAVPKTSTVPDNALGIVPPEVQELFELKAQAEEESKRLYQNTVNGLAPFDRMAKVDTRDNRRNISALSNKYGQKGGMLDTILTSGLYDINGNKVDDRSWVSIVSQVPKEQIGDFNTYLQELHNIDRQAQGKPVTEHTADESRKIVADLNVKYPEFKKYQKEINDYLDKFFHLYLVDAGMMTEQAYREMRKKYPNYIPSFRVGEDSGGGGMKPKKKIKNSTGIGKAVGGISEVMSFDEAVAKKMNTVMSAAVKNDISREVFAFAEALPSEAAKNGVLIQNDNNGKPFDIDDVDRELIRKIDKGNYSVTFYNNGKPQTMKISKDVYEAYEFLEDKIGNSAIRWAANLGNKLTSPMKALTTQYNPLFALTNIIRDAQTYTINNTATKPLQAQKNYVKAIAGIIRRSDAYNQYRALGGSQNGYFGKNIYEQAESRVNPKAVKGKRKAIEVLKTPLTAVEKMGEFTEKIPRFAEYLNTVENLGDTDAGRLQASLNAADVTVNFNRSSTLSTLANAWVPYFNAGLQGADKTFRQIRAHPFKTTARATVSVFLPTLLLYLVNKDNPHWKDVKDGVRDGYYLIPNVLGPNSGGYAETFIRVPKSREFGALLSASFERFIRAVDEAVENDKDMKETLPTAFDGYMQTFLNSFMPPDILGDNILGSIARLNTNTAWHGGKIVPSTMENVSPRNQYDINTSQLAMNIAEKANKVPFLPDAFKSPMKVDYLIDSYGGYAGDLLQGLTSRKNIGEDNMGTVLNSLYNGFVQPAKQRFTTDSAYSSYNLERFYNRVNELDKAANDRDIDEGLPTEYRTPEEKVLSDFTKARSDIADITKQERAVLERAIPISEKNKEIRQLKQEKNRIAKDILQREDELYKGYTENYIPKLSGLTDDRQEAAKQLYNDYGLTYDEYLDMYDKYKEINDMDVNKRLKATYFEDYLESLGYTDQYNIKPELQDEFSYWNMTPATSYYGSKDYQKVNGILPVETYADLSSIVNGLESNVDYPKGKRSPYVKSLIDRYLERYGYNPTYGERMKIYDSMGVAKGYRY